MLFCLSLLCGYAQTLTTIAGTGAAGAAGRSMDQPFGLAVGPDGALYFCEVGNHRISRLDLKTRKIEVIAGTGEKGYSGDGGPAAAATMDEPYELAFNGARDLFFCDRTNHVVRRIDHATHRISTVAGTGKEGFSGDGGPAVQAQLRQPHSIAFAADGLLLICDILNFRIRGLELPAGRITTWAGTGQRGTAAEGAPIASTPLDGPRALAIDRRGNYYLALREGNAIYRLDVKAARCFGLPGRGRRAFQGTAGMRGRRVCRVRKVWPARPMAVCISPTQRIMSSGGWTRRA
ncbi:MAG: hypothetical protein M3N54_16290 [Acidobacteriota bacterium]|nr:hypothetical protein [Acidobacteriota bacterium]